MKEGSGLLDQDITPRGNSGEASADQLIYDQRGLLRFVEDDVDQEVLVASLGAGFDAGSSLYQSEKSVLSRLSSSISSSSSKEEQRRRRSEISNGSEEEEDKETIIPGIFCINCGSRHPFESNYPKKSCDKCGALLVIPQEYLGEVSSSEEEEEYDPFMNVKSLGEIKRPPTKPHPFETLAADGAIYEVKFKAGKCGLSFDQDWLGSALVVDDLPLDEFINHGHDVESEQHELRSPIHVGDFLVSINGAGCMGLPQERVDEILAEAQESGPYKVRFRTAPRTDVIFASDDAYEAKSLIYKQKSKIYEPPEHMDMVYGYVKRYRGARIISLHFFRESDNKFLLAAVLPRSGKGRVVFHNSQHVKTDGHINDIPIHPESSRYLGCMSQNMAGTEFTIHDYRVENPTSTRKLVNHELGFILYQTNVMGRVPNSLRAALPRWDPHQGLKGQRTSIAARYRGSTKTRLAQDMSIIQKLQAKKVDEYRAVDPEELEDLLEFDTLKPSWNEDLQAWTLNFNSRVKLPSKKNFMLVPDPRNEVMEEEFGSETVCLRFGKVKKHHFTLDFRHPISPIQALAIAATSFTQKMLVT